MPYNVITPVTPQNIVWGDLTGKAGYCLKVNDTETDVEILELRTTWTLPTTDANVLFWYDYSNVTYSGNDITAITDKSPNGNNATSLSMTSTKSSSTLNSKYYATLTTGKKHLVSANGCPTSGHAFMWFILLRRTGSAFSDLLYNYGSGGNAIRISTSSDVLMSMNGTNVSVSSMTNNIRLLTYCYDGTNMKFYYNGELKNTTASAWTWTKYQLNFYDNGTDGGMFVGDIFETLMYNDFDDDKRKRIEADICYRWGVLSTSLYSGHTYYGVRPYTIP